jgi:2-polyprenyl-3-methyl-5-hydroxy-6-metoxy-1,4-benzoquinol methylase
MKRTEKKEDFYNEGYLDNPKYGCHYSESPYFEIWEGIVKQIKKDANVLDLGCGTGQFANMLIDNGIGYSYGVDFSETAIKMARNVNKGNDFCVGDLRSTDFYQLKEHNTVICLEVLEHIEDDLTILKNIKKGTNIIISVPNYDSAGHVRYFHNIQRVIQRYGSYFNVEYHKKYPAGINKEIFVLFGNK